ncbi:unnamed protein product [Amoebophrya sp. A120]|nr:unnamed protein product [Amoebophrya sp. A120]|eukprot:GSA120T00017136001.1
MRHAAVRRRASRSLLRRPERTTGAHGAGTSLQPSAKPSQNPVPPNEASGRCWESSSSAASAAFSSSSSPCPSSTTKKCSTPAWSTSRVASFRRRGTKRTPPTSTPLDKVDARTRLDMKVAFLPSSRNPRPKLLWRLQQTQTGATTQPLHHLFERWRQSSALSMLFNSVGHLSMCLSVAPICPPKLFWIMPLLLLRSAFRTHLVTNMTALRNAVTRQCSSVSCRRIIAHDSTPMLGVAEGTSTGRGENLMAGTQTTTVLSVPSNQDLAASSPSCSTTSSAASSSSSRSPRDRPTRTPLPPRYELTLRYAGGFRRILTIGKLTENELRQQATESTRSRAVEIFGPVWAKKLFPTLRRLPEVGEVGDEEHGDIESQRPHSFRSSSRPTSGSTSSSSTAHAHDNDGCNSISFSNSVISDTNLAPLSAVLDSTLISFDLDKCTIPKQLRKQKWFRDEEEPYFVLEERTEYDRTRKQTIAAEVNCMGVRRSIARALAIRMLAERAMSKKCIRWCHDGRIFRRKSVRRIFSRKARRRSGRADGGTADRIVVESDKKTTHTHVATPAAAHSSSAEATPTGACASSSSPPTSSTGGRVFSSASDIQLQQRGQRQPQHDHEPKARCSVERDHASTNQNTGRAAAAPSAGSKANVPPFAEQLRLVRNRVDFLLQRRLQRYKASLDSFLRNYHPAFLQGELEVDVFRKDKASDWKVRGEEAEAPTATSGDHEGSRPSSSFSLSRITHEAPRSVGDVTLPGPTCEYSAEADVGQQETSRKKNEGHLREDPKRRYHMRTKMKLPIARIPASVIGRPWHHMTLNDVRDFTRSRTLLSNLTGTSSVNRYGNGGATCNSGQHEDGHGAEGAARGEKNADDATIIEIGPFVFHIVTPHAKADRVKRVSLQRELQTMLKKDRSDALRTFFGGLLLLGVSQTIFEDLL